MLLQRAKWGIENNVEQIWRTKTPTKDGDEQLSVPIIFKKYIYKYIYVWGGGCLGRWVDGEYVSVSFFFFSPLVAEDERLFSWHPVC